MMVRLESSSTWKSLIIKIFPLLQRNAWLNYWRRRVNHGTIFFNTLFSCIKRNLVQNHLAWIYLKSFFSLLVNRNTLLTALILGLVTWASREMCKFKYVERQSTVRF